MNIVVTGSTGFIAQRIDKEYSNKHNIVLLGRKDLNLLDFSEVKKVFISLKPDLIIHTAAMTSTQVCEDNPELSYEINVEASLNIGKIANEIESKLLFFSTEQVFNGNPEDGPYKETDNPIPNTVYGKTKLKAEQLLKQEIDRLWIIRLSWLFGLPERNLKTGTNLVWNVINANLQN